MGAQVEHGFSPTAATARNNFKLLKLFLSRWRHATPLPLDVLRGQIAAPMEGITSRGTLQVTARRRFGLEVLATGLPRPLMRFASGCRSESHTQDSRGQYRRNVEEILKACSLAKP